MTPEQKKRLRNLADTRTTLPSLYGKFHSSLQRLGDTTESNPNLCGTCSSLALYVQQVGKHVGHLSALLPSATPFEQYEIRRCLETLREKFRYTLDDETLYRLQLDLRYLIKLLNEGDEKMSRYLERREFQVEVRKRLQETDEAFLSTLALLSELFLYTVTLPTRTSYDAKNN